MRIFIPIIFLAATVALFFWYIDPVYGQIRALQAEQAQLDQALTRARDLQELRDDKISEYNAFLPADKERLNKLLPDHIDNVRLIIDLDGMASQYGMRVRGVNVSSDVVQPGSGTIGPSESAYESVTISFTVSGTYDTFRSFLKDLEQSLRLIDVTQLHFSSTQTGIYEYAITFKTYWLKP